jgi:hypothetical protein
MKNIHTLLTQNSSRLGLHQDNKLYLHDNTLTKNLPYFRPQHIYITSDEEIKEGDCVIDNVGRIWIKMEDCFVKAAKDNAYGKSYKIILTTDQDLIKDGVQAIDDEFLEWFVKNPSCEDVEVEKEQYILQHLFKPQEYKFRFKIIIPKEEPKQETLDYLQVCKSCGSEEVARCKWVNVNTEEIYSADSGTTLEWCFDCKSETNIIDKEDYETRNT